MHLIHEFCHVLIQLGKLVEGYRDGGGTLLVVGQGTQETNGSE